MKGREINSKFFQQSKQSSHEQFVNQTSLKKKFQQARKEGNLNLSSCQPPLQAIPKEVFQLDTYLEEDEKFWECEPLKLIDISFNQIVSIPKEAQNLTTCLTFKARNNKINSSEIANEFFEGNINLRLLDLSYNELTRLYEGVGAMNELKELILSHNQLVEIPSSLSYCDKLRTLDLSFNQLPALPPSIQWKYLVQLDLSNNKLNKIPESLCQCTMLETLNLFNNQLTQLPPNIAQLTSLKLLNCGQNNLSIFPFSSFSVPLLKLTHLILSFNQISSLPSEIIRIFPNIIEILITNNQLTSLPMDLYQLNELKVLDVTNNNLGDLPYSLGYMPNLQIIRFEGNCIRSIRQAILSKPTEEIKKYLRTKGELSSLPSFIATVGGPNVGPTSAEIAKANSKFQEEEIQDTWATTSSTYGRQAPPPKASSSSTSLGANKRPSQQSALKSNPYLPATLTFEDKIQQRLIDSSQGSVDLSSLDLSNLSSKEIEVILRFPTVDAIKTIVCNQCQLTSLPMELLSMVSNCNKIVLSNNRIVKLSSHILLDGLLSLDLSHNHLQSSLLVNLLPCFPCLHELIIHHNVLANTLSLQSYFMSSASQQLRVLDLSYCQLNSLNFLSFSLLPNLKYLDVSNNKLSSLSSDSSSQDILASNKLEFISIENNEFIDIPLVLALLPQLKTLLIAGNPQKIIRPAVVQQGSVKVIEMLKLKCPPNLLSMTNLTSELPTEVDNRTIPRPPMHSNSIVARSSRLQPPASYATSQHASAHSEQQFRSSSLGEYMDRSSISSSRAPPRTEFQERPSSSSTSSTTDRRSVLKQLNMKRLNANN